MARATAEMVAYVIVHKYEVLLKLPNESKLRLIFSEPKYSSISCANMHSFTPWLRTTTIQHCTSIKLLHLQKKIEIFFITHSFFKKSKSGTYITHSAIQTQPLWSDIERVLC